MLLISGLDKARKAKKSHLVIAISDGDRKGIYPADLSKAIGLMKNDEKFLVMEHCKVSKLAECIV